MKSYINLLLVILSGLLPAVVFGQEAEEARLREVIEQETKGFVNNSFAAIAEKYWIMDAQTVLNVTGPDGSNEQVFKEDIENRTEVPPPNHATPVKSNYQYLINGDMAVVTYDQGVSFPGTDFILRSTEIRVLEKVNGDWKIHLSSVHHYFPEKKQ